MPSVERALSAPRALLAVCCLAWAALGACQKKDSASTAEAGVAARTESGSAESGPAAAASPAPPRPDSGLGSRAQPSLESLAAAVSRSLVAGDTAALVALALDDSLYRRYVWPKTKGYSPTSEKAFRFIRGMHQANSRKGLRRRLWAAEDTLGALKPGLVFPVVEDNAAPGARVVRIDGREPFAPFGSAVEIGGAWQVLSYGGPGVKDEAASDPE